MTLSPTLVLQARSPTISQLVEDCARGSLGFDELCIQVARMGYKTTSLFEMVCAAEEGLKE